MKTLLFITILALMPILAVGQTDTFRSLTTRPDPPTRVQTDTIPVILLCCDTAGYTTTYVDKTRTKTKTCTPTVDEYHPQLSGYVVWMRGYEIRKVTGYYRGSPEPNADGTVYSITVAYPIWETIAYLNSFKQLLTGYLVWETREVKK